MSDFNAQKNRIVWIDIPVIELDRARTFYAAVLDVEVSHETFGDINFGVIHHEDGNGGCLVIRPNEIAERQGILVYFNTEGRIHDAAAKAEQNGGTIVEPVHSIGPHGYRAILRDSEGNRMAIHSKGA